MASNRLLYEAVGVDKSRKMRCHLFSAILLRIAQIVVGEPERRETCTVPPHHIDEELNKLDQADPVLVRAIRDRLLVSPHPGGRQPEEYRFPGPGSMRIHLGGIESTHRRINGQLGQPIAVDRLYQGRKTEGFFIEAGAFDGFTISNTLYFELKRNWTGLLVEANPESFAKLLKVRRRAWSFPRCLSTKTSPETVNFSVGAGMLGGIENGADPSRPKPGQGEFGNENRTAQMQCFPIFSVLLALDNPTVDYLSLDVEGAEYQVLKTIPWSEVDIRVIDVDVSHLDEVFEGTVEDLRALLSSHGYRPAQRMHWDEIFVREDEQTFWL